MDSKITIANYLKIATFVLTKVGVSIHWSFIYNVMLPSDILTIVSERNKEFTLGLVLGLGNVAQVIAGFFFGLMSDFVDIPTPKRNRAFWSLFLGQRKPYILIFILGVLFFFIGRLLFVIPNGGWFWMFFYALFVILGEFCFAAQSICFYALIPECFRENQIGLVSGLVSGADLFGVALGIGLFGSIFKNFSEFAIVSSIVSLIAVLCATFLFFPESPPDTKLIPLISGENAPDFSGINENDVIENSVFSDDENNASKQSRKTEIPKKQQVVGQQTEEEDFFSFQKQNEDDTIEPFLNGKASTNIVMNNDDSDDYEENNESFGTTTSESENELAKQIPISQSNSNSKITLQKILLFVGLSVVKPLVVSANFRTVFCIIFCMGYAISSTENFFNYYLKDVVGTQNFVIFGFKITEQVEKAQSVFMGSMLCSTLCFAAVGGWVSDKIGSKIIIFCSAVGFIIFELLLMIYHEFTALVLASVLFGACIGFYMSSALALVSKLIPKNPAKAAGIDFGNSNPNKKSSLGYGIMALAMELPIIISVPLGGFFLSNGKKITFSFKNSMIYALSQTNLPYGEWLEKNHISTQSDPFATTLGWVMMLLSCIFLHLVTLLLVVVFLDEKKVFEEHAKMSSLEDALEQQEKARMRTDKIAKGKKKSQKKHHRRSRKNESSKKEGDIFQQL